MSNLTYSNVVLVFILAGWNINGGLDTSKFTEQRYDEKFFMNEVTRIVIVYLNERANDSETS